MVGAAVYGVVQLAVLAWPVRSVRLSTVLLALVVGAYGSGVFVLVVTLAWWRVSVAAGGVPSEISEDITEHVAPVVEELAKVGPLLLAAWWAGRARQWGLADFVLLGAAVGSGFGLLETMIESMPDAADLTALDEGWMGEAGLSLNAAYYPSFEQVLTSWLPSGTGVLEIGLGWDGVISTNRHLPYGMLDGLAVGLLVRGRGGWRAVGVVPLAAAVAHHWGINNAGAEDFPGWAADLIQTTDDWLSVIATGCLLLAMLTDRRLLAWGKATVPGVLLAAERGSGVAGLVGAANRCLPYSLLAVTRFVRARRHVLYAAARTRSDRLDTVEPLRQAVAETAALMDHAHHHGRWDPVRIRAATKAARAARRSGRRWLLLATSVLLSLPSVLYLGVGNFPSTAGLGEWFTTTPGLTLLFACAAASLALTVLTLVLLARAWRPARAQPTAEPAAAIGLRLIAATGGVIAGGWLLWIRLIGTPLDEQIVNTDRASLFAALNNLLFGLGLALLVIGLFTLFPPAGAAALVTAEGLVISGGAAISIPAATTAILGTTTIAYAEATRDGGNEIPERDSSTSSRDVHDAVRRGERDIDAAYVWENGELYVNAENGRLIKVLDKGNGTSDIVIKDPSGASITRFNAPNSYIERLVERGEWL